MSDFKPKPDAYALLIGVNDYAAYDASAGLAAKTSDLRGAEQDVRQYWRMARALGIPSANIRVACAPGGGEVLDASALPGDSDAAQITGASLAEVEAGIAWLASKLDTSGVSAGMISISSHGSYDAERGSLMCASDTRLDGETLTGALPMSALFTRLAGRPPQTPITIFLDACDAGGGATAQGDRGRALRGTVGARKEVELERRPDDLLLAASAPGSESFEIAVDDNVRGAFSWAALAVLERWGIHRTAADTHFDITYGHLRQRVDALLKAMNVEQAAHFDAQADQAARKVFAELRSIELGTPDRPFFTGGREVSPGSNGYVNRYQIVQKDESGSSPTWTVMADLYAPGTGCGNALKAGVMYWVEQSAGWATFYDALSALTSDVSFKMTPKPAIDYSKDVQGLTLEQSILAGQTYETGAIWLQIDAPTLSTGTLHGKFTYDAKECYVCGDSDGRLVWLLDKDVSLPSNGWLLDTTSPDLHIQKTGATLSGDYFEADDA